MSITAMKKAREALKFGLHVGFDESSESQIKKGGKAFDQHSKAIAAINAAIAAAEKQEPVAWAVFEGWNAHDLYLPQEYDEALKMAGYKGDHAEVKPLYTTLPAAQRPWVGLTDDDFQSICANFRVAHGGWVDMLVLQIEAKLKEKNIG